MADCETSVASAGHQRQGSQTPPRSEWLAATIGLVIVLGIFGVLTCEAVNGGESPPDIASRIVAIRPASKGYLVQVEVSNLGGEATAGLTLEGTLKQGTQAIESSETTLDYVPGQSQRDVGLFFSDNPEQYRLELRAFGYQEP